ncbi:MAG TPA: type II toxin-antitoxin system VapC family toxin [Spirochaetota bacterium]|nr:type II toxin-antitoxin system VapC family toxin [Spirochaetota bacterium]HPI21999.1 type II toxin-antitoxin system VapC family toxin [Spirochaetota bacterium]HPU88191.1 type II toxin-antitoxin system VapC family toxin [Spirochaetota bacterium]
MKYILDTNICVYALKNMFPSIAAHLKSVRPSDVAIPTIVEAELLLGAYKSSAREATIRAVSLFLEPITRIPFGEREAQCYADIRAGLEKRGVPIGPNDYIVAASAVAHRATLVTHNTGEFSRVPGLVICDWCEA